MWELRKQQEIRDAFHCSVNFRSPGSRHQLKHPSHIQSLRQSFQYILHIQFDGILPRVDRSHNALLFFFDLPRNERSTRLCRFRAHSSSVIRIRSNAQVSRTRRFLLCCWLLCLRSTVRFTHLKKTKDSAQSNRHWPVINPNVIRSRGVLRTYRMLDSMHDADGWIVLCGEHILQTSKGKSSPKLYNIVASFIFRLMVIRGDNPTSKDAIKLICLVSLPVTAVTSVCRIIDNIDQLHFWRLRSSLLAMMIPIFENLWIRGFRSMRQICTPLQVRYT